MYKEAPNTLSGLELMQVAQKGEPPTPALKAFDVSFGSVEKGAASFSVTFNKNLHADKNGKMHIGPTLIMLDGATGVPLFAMLSKDEACVTSSLNIKFNASVAHLTGKITAEGKGSKINELEGVGLATLKNEAGEIYAEATANMAIREKGNYKFPEFNFSKRNKKRPTSGEHGSFIDHLGVEFPNDGPTQLKPDVEIHGNRFGFFHGGITASFLACAANQLIEKQYPGRSYMIK